MMQTSVLADLKPRANAWRFAAAVGFTLIATALTAATAPPQTEGIGGVYCGKAESSGQMVDVRTTLKLKANGLLSGDYQFADKGEISPGVVQEYVAPSGNSRTLVWRDKYGSGRVVMNFDPTGNSFVAAWGPYLEEPSLPWSGKRICDAPST